MGSSILSAPLRADTGLAITFGSLKYLCRDIIRNGLVNILETIQLWLPFSEQKKAVNKCYHILLSFYPSHDWGRVIMIVRYSCMVTAQASLLCILS